MSDGIQFQIVVVKISPKVISFLVEAIVVMDYEPQCGCYCMYKHIVRHRYYEYELAAEMR